jgi:hypothetical protein
MFRGNVAHEVLSQVVTSRAVWSGTGGTMAERARRAAVSLFDQQADRLWAHLGMPGSEADRAELRQIVEASASWLAHALEEGGYTSVVAETKLEAPLGEGMLSGTPDLVLGPTAAVLDLKLGSATSKRKALEAGTAVQLAAYSWLVTRNGRASDLPPVGYFVMTAGRLLTTEPDAFPRSTHVEGPDIHSTWTAVDSTLRSTLAALRDGRLSARGVACGEEKVVERAHLVDDVIVLEPPCRFCEYGGLCGRSFGQMERDVDGG